MNVARRDAAAAVTHGVPACGFVGWGPDSAALLEVLRRRDGDVDARAAVLAAPGSAAGHPGAPGRTLPTLEALFGAVDLVFVEGGQAALEPHLAMMRLAISDRHVVVLLGGGWSLSAVLEHLRERKVARCLLLPSGADRLGTAAIHASPYFAPEELAAFRALFDHLDVCVELGDERHFEVLQGMADFAPAAFYTMLEAMADGVVMMGFSRAAAMQLLASLLHGAAERVLRGDASAAQLREHALEIDVAAAGLLELESAGLRGTVMRAVQQAVRGRRTTGAGPRDARMAESPTQRGGRPTGAANSPDDEDASHD